MSDEAYWQMLLRMKQRRRVLRIFTVVFFVLLGLVGLTAWVALAYFGEWMRVQTWKEFGWVK